MGENPVTCHADLEELYREPVASNRFVHFSMEEMWRERKAQNRSAYTASAKLELFFEASRAFVSSSPKGHKQGGEPA